VRYYRQNYIAPSHILPPSPFSLTIIKIIILIAPQKRRLTHSASKTNTAPKSRTRKPKKEAEKTFPFFLLPAELREQIYQYALTTPDPLQLSAKWVSSRRTVQRSFLEPDYRHNYRRHARHQDHDAIAKSKDEYASRKSQNALTPALLGTCKQIRDEAIGILYGQEIVVQNCSTLFTWLGAIGSANRRFVRDVTIREWSGGRGVYKAHIGAAFALLADCMNLKRLFFDFEFLAWHRSVRAGAESLFREGHWFFEAYGAANGGRKDAVLDVLCFGERNYKNAWWGQGGKATSHEENVEGMKERLGQLLNRDGKRKGRKTVKISG
jgi:hypothetical protein